MYKRQGEEDPYKKPREDEDFDDSDDSDDFDDSDEYEDYENSENDFVEDKAPATDDLDDSAHSEL